MRFMSKSNSRQRKLSKNRPSLWLGAEFLHDGSALAAALSAYPVDPLWGGHSRFGDVDGDAQAVKLTRKSFGVSRYIGPLSRKFLELLSRRFRLGVYFLVAAMCFCCFAWSVSGGLSCVQVSGLCCCVLSEDEADDGVRKLGCCERCGTGRRIDEARNV